MDRLREAPIGTRAPAIGGGRWYRTEHGWKWNGPDGTGSTFPRPGADWTGDLIYPVADDDSDELNEDEIVTAALAEIATGEPAE